MGALKIRQKPHFSELMLDSEKSTAEWLKKKVSSGTKIVLILLNIEKRNASQIRLGGPKKKNNFNRHKIPAHFNKNATLI